MNAKVGIGIGVGIIVLIGIGIVFSSSYDSTNNEIDADINESLVLEDTTNSESSGNQFTVKLSDSVTAVGP